MNSDSNVRPEVILLVDHESRMRAVSRTILAAEGYTVLEADNGMEALLLAAEQRGHVDLLLTDLEMPRISGARLAGAFELLWPGVPVMYLPNDGSQPAPTPITTRSTVVAKSVLSLLLKNRVEGLLEASKRPLII